MIEQLTFQADGHKYFYGDKEILSVTQRINKIFPYNSYGRASEIAMEAGNNIHEATKLIDLNSIGMQDLDPAYIPYVVGWVNYREYLFRCIPGPIKQSFIDQEPGFYHLDHRYAGTPDRVYVTDTHIYIIDIKTGLPSEARDKRTGLQLFGYGGLIEANLDPTRNKLIVLRAVYLPGDNKFKEREFQFTATNYRIFWSLLNLSRYVGDVQI